MCFILTPASVVFLFVIHEWFWSDNYSRLRQQQLPTFSKSSLSALERFNHTVEATKLVDVAVILWQVITEIKNALWQNYLKSVKEECEVVIECCLSSNVTHSAMKCGRGGGKILKNISPKCSRSAEERRGDKKNYFVKTFNQQKRLKMTETDF